jgi:hypothetical protein
MLTLETVVDRPVDDRTAPPRQIGVREFRGNMTEFSRGTAFMQQGTA